MTPSNDESEDPGWGSEYEVEEYPISQVEMIKSTSINDGPILTRGFSFKMIQENEIEGKQSKRVDDLANLLNVSVCVAKGLLLLNFWDSEKIKDKYYDSDLLMQLFNYDGTV